MTRRPKRSYKVVAVSPSDDGFALLLDGKPAKFGGTVITLPTCMLAEAVAQEWREQEKLLDRERMRLTVLAASAPTRVPGKRGEVIEHVLGYGHNELLCYRAAEPSDLAARQKALWDPLLEWIQTSHAVRLVADAGISFIEQPVDAPVRMQRTVCAFDDFALAALDAAASLCASFVVGLALIERRIGADEAFAISHLDELYQAEKWGHDAEGESRRTRLLAELRAVERFIFLLKDSQ